MTAIGTFRHHVTLDAPGAPIPDGDGGYTEVFTPLAPAEWWCSIQPATGTDMERVVGEAAVQTTASHIVRGPYHPGITTSTRVHFGARLLHVQSVQNEWERDRWLILLCSEVK